MGVRCMCVCVCLTTYKSKVGEASFSCLNRRLCFDKSSPSVLQVLHMRREVGVGLNNALKQGMGNVQPLFGYMHSYCISIRSLFLFMVVGRLPDTNRL